MNHGPLGDDQTPEIHSDDAVDWDDFFAVITAYFPRLNDVHALRAYCRPSRLGPPSLFLAYWNHRPAAVHAVFPFPLWMHGCATVAGKPEFGSLHPDVVYRYPRPDIFGMMIDAMVARARERALPVLVAWPSLLSLKSHCRKGFHEVPMPYTSATWLLWHSPREALAQIRQAAGILRKLKALARITLMALYTAYVRVVAMGHRLSIHEIPADAIDNYRDIIEANYWPNDRITVRRDVDFIRSRIREGSGIKVLAVSLNSTVRGVVFAQLIDDDLHIYDILPTMAYRQVALWRAFLQFGLSLRARTVSARFYDNNPAHAEALSVIRTPLRAVLQRGVLRLAVLSLDPALTSVYDTTAWCGTDMLGIGF